MLLFTYPASFVRQRFKCEMVSSFFYLIGGEWEQKSVLRVAWKSMMAVRAKGSVFFDVPLHLQSRNCGYGPRCALSSFALFTRGISRNDACVRLPNINWFSWSKRLSVLLRVGQCSIENEHESCYAAEKCRGQFHRVRFFQSACISSLPERIWGSITARNFISGEHA